MTDELQLLSLASNKAKSAERSSLINPVYPPIAKEYGNLYSGCLVGVANAGPNNVFRAMCVDKIIVLQPSQRMNLHLYVRGPARTQRLHFYKGKTIAEEQHNFGRARG